MASCIVARTAAIFGFHVAPSRGDLTPKENEMLARCVSVHGYNFDRCLAQSLHLNMMCATVSRSCPEAHMYDAARLIQ